MPKVQKDLVNKVQSLADHVKEDLRKKGIVVPTKQKDGSIHFNEYVMLKKTDGFYIYRKEVYVAGPINLPQTAIVLANGLALGKTLDEQILRRDLWYGFRQFDEAVYTRSAKNNLKNKNYDKADVCLVRADIAKQQKELYKNDIMCQFNRIKLA